MQKKDIVVACWQFDQNLKEDQNYLQQAKKYWEKLIVIVVRDKELLKNKWIISKYNESERLAYVKKLNIADKIELWQEWDCFEAMKKYRPDVVALRSDKWKLLAKLWEFLFESWIITSVVTIDVKEKKEKIDTKEKKEKIVLQNR